MERVRDDMRTAGMTPSEEYLQDSPDTSGSCALDINSVQRVMEVWSFYRYPLFNWWCVNYFSTSTLPSYARHKRTESRQSRGNCSKRNDWKGKERKGLLVAFDSCPPKKKSSKSSIRITLNEKKKWRTYLERNAQLWMINLLGCMFLLFKGAVFFFSSFFFFNESLYQWNKFVVYM